MRRIVRCKLAGLQVEYPILHAYETGLRMLTKTPAGEREVDMNMVESVRDALAAEAGVCCKLAPNYRVWVDWPVAQVRAVTTQVAPDGG